MHDDPYPNEGSHYQAGVPDETKNANTEELRKAEQALPFIDDVLAWFDKTVEDTDSVALALNLSLQFEKPVDSILIALDVTRQYLNEKKAELEALSQTIKR